MIFYIVWFQVSIPKMKLAQKESKSRYNFFLPELIFRFFYLIFVIIGSHISLWIISECVKQAQKEYKTRHDWVGKVINWELCKKMTFDHTTKWSMQKLDSVPENDPHKILWDVEMQTDHFILADDGTCC